ncbi:MAG: hypothetical protein E6H48_11870 [Betaproteobacteria bacterium]|nr:MAG: hypothetical protein E6H71_11035 [Betaproteobacteria bacterium]TMH66266.1 MAG: hypothetical protein E6H48_11870 [Betaproteobacteria bacterium]
MMRRKTWSMIAAGTALACAAGLASAMNCYTVLDRNDNVVYRGTIPPIDLSERGAPERQAMRQRGQHMIAMDADRCPGVEFFTGSAGSSTLTVDQIVGGIVPLRGQSPAGNVPASNATSGTAIPSRPPTSAVPVK